MTNKEDKIVERICKDLTEKIQNNELPYIDKPIEGIRSRQIIALISELVEQGVLK